MDRMPSQDSKLARISRSMPIRLVVMFVALAALDLACQILGGFAVHRVPPLAQTATGLGAALLLSVLMIAAYRWLVHTLEKRAADELSSAEAARRLVQGVVVGAALFVAVYGVLFALGAVTFQGSGGLSGLGVALAIAVSSAVGEEIVFRGVVFRLLEGRLGTTLALILSAGAFGLIHAGNDGATWVSTLAIALESGVLLALAYAASRSLWLPIGLHFGWNFTEGGIFGAAVSGGKYTGLISAHLSGARAITGGAFGPEASVVALAVALSGSAFLAWHTMRKRAWRRSIWGTSS